MKDNHPLLEATRSLRNRLMEWLEAPFYEKKEDWQKWLCEFRPKVERDLKAAQQTIDSQLQQLPHDDDCTCGYCTAN